jgi:selenocysteine-specific elongation factor
MDIIVGTAGHIDHGKTALVLALTGTDADRLPEEKQRGITIDIGFAELALGDIRFGFVDVPGHERFVKNMLAGAGGIDLVLLVIAADEGVMPQTREHFDICRLLDIRNGIIVITKSDLVDAEMLELVRLEAAELVENTFLDGAPMVAASSRTGDGLEELRSALIDAALHVPKRDDRHVSRLPIDRSFAIKGFGTVVTGTLLSGSITEGSEIELLPVGRRLRVRGVQSHGKHVEAATSGRRTAVNLGGIDHHEIERGMLLSEPGVLEPAQILDAHIDMLAGAPRPLRSRHRVRVHLGTAEILARVAIIGGQSIEPGQRGFVQLRLESTTAATLGDRFILRSYSPQVTIGGGVILRPTTEKFRARDVGSRRAFLERLYNATTDGEVLTELVRHNGEKGISASDVRSVTGWAEQTLRSAHAVVSDEIATLDDVLIAQKDLDRLSSDVLETVRQYLSSNRISGAVPLQSIRSERLKSLRPQIERAVLAALASANKIIIEGDSVRLPGHTAQLSDAETSAVDTFRNMLSAAGLEVPKTDELISNVARETSIDLKTAQKLFSQLLASGELLKISNEFCFQTAAIEKLIAHLHEYADRSTDRLIDVAKFKDLTGLSRKYAIPLLEYLDQRKITARKGEKRIII